MIIPEDKRPVCSCGHKMQIVEFKGYYDEFKYFECHKCNIDPDVFQADSEWHGAYA